MPMQVNVIGDPYSDCTVTVDHDGEQHEVLITVEGDAETAVIFAPVSTDPAVLVAAFRAWQQEVIGE
jgi:VCBS repeat-containing protein